MAAAEAAGAVPAAGEVTDMILDTGICTVYRKENTASPGSKPTWNDTKIHESYYGELNFETSPSRPTDNREEINTAARVRILQNRRIANHDRVKLERFGSEERPEAEELFEVTRAWHGTDADSGDEITDLTLEVVKP